MTHSSPLMASFIWSKVGKVWIHFQRKICCFFIYKTIFKCKTLYVKNLPQFIYFSLLLKRPTYFIYFYLRIKWRKKKRISIKESECFSSFNNIYLHFHVYKKIKLWIENACWYFESKRMIDNKFVFYIKNDYLNVKVSEVNECRKIFKKIKTCFYALWNFYSIRVFLFEWSCIFLFVQAIHKEQNVTFHVWYIFFRYGCEYFHYYKNFNVFITSSHCS